jgi:hydroxyquinol 1,2-dioxygenase
MAIDEGVGMRNINHETVTQAVLASMSNCGSERLLSVMKGLVQHLHAFASEVKLTEDEWFNAIQFLTEVGAMTNDNRQEFVLLSDTLGLSMLVTAQNNRKPAACTEATVLGPFYVAGAPEFDNGDDISNGAPGVPCFVSGTVRGLSGGPVAGASLDIWQSDEDGFYDVQKVPDALGDVTQRALDYTLGPMAVLISVRFLPSLIPFRMTGLWVACSLRSAVLHGDLHIYISGSGRRVMSH